MSVIGLLYWLSRLVAIGAIIHVVLDNRQPAKTMAWALVIYFLPLVGVIAYIFFGVNRRKEKFISRRSLDMLSKRSMLEFVEQRHLELPTDYQPLIDLCSQQSFSLPFINKKSDILLSGYEFFPRLLRDIAQAKNHIHIDIYIFEADALGNLVADALIDKARSGVHVRVIYDDVGCWKVSGASLSACAARASTWSPSCPCASPSSPVRPTTATTAKSSLSMAPWATWVA